MNEAKPFMIEKKLVYHGYLKVKAHRGSSGIDGVEMKTYEQNMPQNLYKLWNRMSSGCYFPSPVMLVEIPKPNGGKRPLGIPTIEDRIAQMAVVLEIGPRLEELFDEDSYGYRPNKSAHQAIAKARERCYQAPWVLDMDISKFFDTIDHDLLMKAVRLHVQEKWILLYIERWLKVPYQTKDDHLIERLMGVPQGSVIGPVLANLFLHYVFDEWMRRNHSEIKFERYADDTICHCWTEDQAEWLKKVLVDRFGKCKLKLNEEKTRIVYCKMGERTLKAKLTAFDYLGMTFRPRAARNGKTGKIFTTFSPAISKKSAMKIRDKIRELNLNRCTFSGIDDIADKINPMVNGWINYYARFGRTEFRRVMHYLNERLARWTMRKFKLFKGSFWRALEWLAGVAKVKPLLFAHWSQEYVPYFK